MGLLKRIFIGVVYFMFIDFKITRWYFGGYWEKWTYAYHTHLGTRWIQVEKLSIPYGAVPEDKCRGPQPLIKEDYEARRSSNETT